MNIFLDNIKLKGNKSFNLISNKLSTVDVCNFNQLMMGNY